jgi:hypothetical protein
MIPLSAVAPDPAWTRWSDGGPGGGSPFRPGAWLLPGLLAVALAALAVAPADGPRITDAPHPRGLAQGGSREHA